MSFFDDSHVTDVGLQGSLGPSVSLGEVVQQSFRQQIRVDSALALDTELRTRWLDSLTRAQIQQTDDSDPDRFAYAAFAQSIQGQPIDVFDLNPWEGDLTERFKGMAAANEAIKKLNNPEIKSFEQILEEVSQMQQEVEGESASMYERSGRGGFIASLLGAVAGSFSTRDPLNIATAPIGVGRTVVARIASDMGIAAAVTGVTEIMDVAPARKIAGLQERDPLLNIAAATIGAGVIRGGIEGIEYGVSRLRSENIDFDLRDTQLQQMFEANVEKPSARAGLSILDDTRFIERNNPYGEGRAAQERFLAELQSVQRAMNAEPMTAVARVLPPVPFEQLKKVADFEIVREQAPQLYAKMEAAQEKVLNKQARLYTLSKEELEDIAKSGPREKDVEEGTITREQAQDILRGHLPYDTWRTEDLVDQIRSVLINNREKDWIQQVTSGNAGLASDLQRDYLRLNGSIGALKSRGYDLDTLAPDLKKNMIERGWGAEDAEEVLTSRLENQRKARTEYQAAYRAVEAEAAAINTRQRAAEAVQQHESVNILASEGLPFTGPLLRHDGVESLVEQINKFNDTLDERTAARFVRETLGEGENKVEVEVWEKDGGIDIGLKDPVDPNFTFMTDDGEMTVAQAMRDLQDDTDLVEAVKGCAI